MKVFLCEKPSQARDIAKVIGAHSRGEGYLSGNSVFVTWAFGHLLELREPERYDERFKRWNFNDLPITPDPWVVDVKKESRKQFNAIKQLIGKASEVCIATDADREGEMIGWEILEYCNFRGSISRLWLSALDEASIRKALSQVRRGQQTYPLYQAGLGRSRADWLVGINLTRAFTLLGQRNGVKGVLSVGRVQSPTLKLVVDRDREIHRFVSKPYWEVRATVQLSNNRKFNAMWQPGDSVQLDPDGRCINKAVADAVVSQCNQQPATILSVDGKPKKEAAPLCLDLSSLQQLADKRYGYGAQQVLDTAQSLYEKHKATSYPRTDCRYLPESMLSEVRGVLSTAASVDPDLSKLLQSRLFDHDRRSRVWNDTKISAHHAIIPTSQAFSLSALSEVERHIYLLIRDHYLMQFLPDFTYVETQVLIDVAAERFKSVGKKVTQRGWRVLSQASESSEEPSNDSVEGELPELTVGEGGRAAPVLLQEKKTTPPKFYTEGTLIAAMKNAGRFVSDPVLRARLRETAGIGTEATRSSIMETLLKRKLLAKKGKAIVSTDTGRALVDSLPGVVTDPGMTALWEQTLDSIAEGKVSLDQFMARQVQFIQKLIGESEHTSTKFQVSATAESDGAAKRGAASKQPVSSPSCPDCGSPMHKRKGAYGAFWGCTKYPACKGIIPVGQKRKKSRT